MKALDKLIEGSFVVTSKYEVLILNALVTVMDTGLAPRQETNR